MFFFFSLYTFFSEKCLVLSQISGKSFCTIFLDNGFLAMFLTGDLPVSHKPTQHATSQLNTLQEKGAEQPYPCTAEKQDKL